MIHPREILSNYVLKTIGNRASVLTELQMLLSVPCARREVFELLLDNKLKDSDGRLPIPNEKNVGLICSEHPAIRHAFPNVNFDVDISDRTDFCYLWGAESSDQNIVPLMRSYRDDSHVLLCEDGFLKSADTWVNPKIPYKFREGCSITVDPYGYYFDATKESLIERMLNDKDIVVNENMLARARKLIKTIISNKLSKYNHQVSAQTEFGRKGRHKVLVVDQSYGDYSIRKGWASEDTFSRMLSDAIRDNPDFDVLVKTHPDTMTGIKNGYFQSVKEKGNLFRVVDPVNPYSIIDQCDKVYVCSTQLGFEALLANREVHVYGMPFYAGWGATIDDQVNPRRTMKRSVEELFYIFYIMYTKWCNPSIGKPCEIEGAIDWLLKIREEYDFWKAKQ